MTDKETTAGQADLPSQLTDSAGAKPRQPTSIDTGYTVITTVLVAIGSLLHDIRDAIPPYLTSVFPFLAVALFLFYGFLFAPKKWRRWLLLTSLVLLIAAFFPYYETQLKQLVYKWSVAKHYNRAISAFLDLRSLDAMDMLSSSTYNNASPNMRLETKLLLGWIAATNGDQTLAKKSASDALSMISTMNSIDQDLVGHAEYLQGYVYACQQDYDSALKYYDIARKQKQLKAYSLELDYATCLLRLGRLEEVAVVLDKFGGLGTSEMQSYKRNSLAIASSSPMNKQYQDRLRKLNYGAKTWQLYYSLASEERSKARPDYKKAVEYYKKAAAIYKNQVAGSILCEPNEDSGPVSSQRKAMYTIAEDEALLLSLEYMSSGHYDEKSLEELSSGYEARKQLVADYSDGWAQDAKIYRGVHYARVALVLLEDTDLNKGKIGEYLESSSGWLDPFLRNYNKSGLGESPLQQQSTIEALLTCYYFEVNGIDVDYMLENNHDAAYFVKEAKVLVDKLGSSTDIGMLRTAGSCYMALSDAAERKLIEDSECSRLLLKAYCIFNAIDEEGSYQLRHINMLIEQGHADLLKKMKSEATDEKWTLNLGNVGEFRNRRLVWDAAKL